MTNWQLIATLISIVGGMLGAAALFASMVSPRIADLKDHIQKQMDSFRNEMKAEIGAFRAEMVAEQRITNHRLEALEARFKPVAAD